MCKIPVVPLHGKGVKEGRRVEIELSDFDETQHRLDGEKTRVKISREDYHEKVSPALKGIIRGRMSMSFGKVLSALDPGSAYPVYQVEVKDNHEILYFWLPKMACELYIPSSIRKGLGVSSAARAAA